MLLRRGLIKLRCLAALDLDRPLRAVPQTRPQTVAQEVGDEPGLAVNDLDGTLRTGGNALPATVAQVFVDGDNLADHVHSLRFATSKVACRGTFEILHDRISRATTP